MSSLLPKFVSRVDFKSYEDFKENLKILVPENFNFAYDVVDAYAAENPDKRALVWCNDHGEEKIITFKDLKIMSDRAANLFSKYGLKRGYGHAHPQEPLGVLGLHGGLKQNRGNLHSFHTYAQGQGLRLSHQEGRSEDDRLHRRERRAGEFDAAHKELGNIFLVKALVGSADQKSEGWINFDKELEDASADFVRPTGEQATRNEDILLAYFTSGTTGYPKMVKHDQTYPLGHILTAKYWQNVGDDGLHYTVADTGWAKCAWGKIYGQWIAGSAVFVYDYDRFDAGRMMDEMDKYGVTTFCAPPTIFRFMIKSDMSKFDFSRLKYAVTAGEPLNPSSMRGSWRPPAYGSWRDSGRRRRWSASPTTCG